MFTENDRAVLQAGIGDAQTKANSAWVAAAATLAELRAFVADVDQRLSAIEAKIRDPE